MPLYSIVWKYKIKPENKEKFEFEYGLNGSWNSLFRKSKNYKGSYLHKSDDEENTYLLIDSWADKTFYEDFKKTNNEIYQKLSATFKHLYEIEEKIGAFNTLK